MAGILDYLNWRGDLTMEQSTFNEVDNLILAELSFVDFEGIVPAPGEGESVPLADAADVFFSRQGKEASKINMGVLVPDQIPVMLKKMTACRRFQNMKLNCFVDWLDAEKAGQFAALTIEVGDGTVYLSFRGTDDTIAGWKEDFLISCMPEVHAQKMAVEYVKNVARQFPRRKLILGGHSKGGNLAAYSGVYCPASIQRRIAGVYSNDGPGFHEDLLELPAHRRIEERIHSIVPKSSVVGMLLEHEENYTVVDSNQAGFLQHDGFSWEVMGDHFVKLRQITEQSRLNDLELTEWVHSMPVAQREKFVDALFDVLTASGATTLTDLKGESFKAVSAMIRAMKEMDKSTREGLFKFIRLLFRSNLRLLLENIQEESEKITAAPLKKWGLEKKTEEGSK